MDRLRAPAAGNLDTGNQPHTDFSAAPACLIKPRRRVVIGQREDLHAGRSGPVNQRRGRQRTIRTT